MDISNIKANKLATILNNELKKSDSISINKACEKLGFKASSVKTKFRRSGYVYDSELRQYVEVKIPEEPIKEVSSQKKVEIKGDMAFKTNKGINSPNTVEPLTNDEIKAIRKLLAQANDKPSKLQINDKGKFEVSYKHLNDNTITRNIKLSETLNKRFLAFTKTLPPHRLIDIYNTMFEEFLNKYEK